MPEHTPDEQDPYAATDDLASQRRITHTYYIMTALNTLAVGLVVAVNTLFMIDRGLTTIEWSVANAAYSGGMVIFEIPTGVVADTVGRRWSYLLSIVVLFLGTVGMVLFGHDLVTFAAFNLLLGLGYTFASGALEAWVVDALSTMASKASSRRCSLATAPSLPSACCCRPL